MLEEQGARPLAPIAVHMRPGQQGMERVRQRLLPGYVFFEQADAPDWPGIIRYSAVLRVLHYQDETPELRDADLAFVRWLKVHEGLIDVSEVVKAGTKIAFVSGPLVGMEGQVLKVNKGRRQVQIAVGDEGNLFHAIWCSIEYVQEKKEGESAAQ
jgi:transcription antitermination factor NusG